MIRDIVLSKTTKSETVCICIRIGGFDGRHIIIGFLVDGGLVTVLVGDAVDGSGVGNFDGAELGFLEGVEVVGAITCLDVGLK